MTTAIQDCEDHFLVPTPATSCSICTPRSKPRRQPVQRPAGPRPAPQHARRHVVPESMRGPGQLGNLQVVVEAVGEEMRRAGVDTTLFYGRASGSGPARGPADVWTSLLARAAGDYGQLFDHLASGMDFFDVLREIGMSQAIIAIRAGEQLNASATWAQP